MKMIIKNLIFMFFLTQPVFGKIKIQEHKDLENLSKNVKKSDKATEENLKDRLQATQQELMELRVMLEKYSIDHETAMKRHQLEMAEIEIRISKINAENRLEQEKTTQKQLVFMRQQEDLEKEKRTLQTENSLQSEKLQKLSLENQAKNIAQEKEQQSLDLEQNRLGLEQNRLGLEQSKINKMMNELQASVAKIEIEKKLARQVSSPSTYPDKPYERGVLTISDRKIPIDGPILPGLGSHVEGLINFYNNKSNTAPIFIVIEDSPGGSVAEGFRILKAMESSRAPIHVIVKTFAASMSACIVTLADESYAYPNATILHHQMSSRPTGGNMTDLSDSIETAKKWEKRIFAPLLKKLGYKSMSSFKKDLYKHNARGDWMNFADEARKLRWVKNVPHTVNDKGVTIHPDDQAEKNVQRPFVLTSAKKDNNGLFYQEIPAPRPFDFYYLYNPGSFYRQN